MYRQIYPTTISQWADKCNETLEFCIKSELKYIRCINLIIHFPKLKEGYRWLREFEYGFIDKVSVRHKKWDITTLTGKQLSLNKKHCAKQTQAASCWDARPVQIKVLPLTFFDEWFDLSHLHRNLKIVVQLSNIEKLIEMRSDTKFNKSWVDSLCVRKVHLDVEHDKSHIPTVELTSPHKPNVSISTACGDGYPPSVFDDNDAVVALCSCKIYDDYISKNE
jgi:hypothetical protein